MECKVNIVSHELLCMACLCVGRSPKELDEDRLKKFYVETLKEIPLSSIPTDSPTVCWDCKALLRKMVAFRDQVQDCYRILQMYTKEQFQELLLTDISRPPRLDTQIIDPVTIPPSFCEVPPKAEDQETKNFSEVQSVFMKDEKHDWKNENDVKDEPPLSDGSEKDDSDYSNDIAQLELEVRSVVNKDVHESEKEVNKNINNRVKKEVKRKKKGRKKLKDTKVVKNALDVKMVTKQKNEASQRITTIELSFKDMVDERTSESKKGSYATCQYKCDSCLIGFNYQTSHTEHMLSKHEPGNGEYTCPICETVMASYESFTAHYKRHFIRYECGVCGKRTQDRKVMQQHYETKHGVPTTEYKCKLCGKVSSSFDSHRYHKDSHKARVKCTECDKTFSHRAGLMNHRLAVHKFNNEFPCPQCDKVFRWKTSLKKHLQIHERKETSADAVAYCRECAVPFSSVCSYRRHMKNSLKHVTKEQLKYICDHCGRRYANKTKLRDHIEEKHLHRTYQCHICLKPSKNRVCLDQHIRNVHRGRPHDKMCHHCGKGFPTKVQLESHIRSHTGERPYICEFCPTTFSQQSNLYKHNRQVHLNIKCKRETRRADLNRPQGNSFLIAQ